MIANEMANITNVSFKVYLITDLEKDDKIASTEYNGQITTSQLQKFMLIKQKIYTPDYVLEGFIGLLVNIEVNMRTWLLKE